MLQKRGLFLGVAMVYQFEVIDLLFQNEVVGLEVFERLLNFLANEQNLVLIELLLQDEVVLGLLELLRQFRKGKLEFLVHGRVEALELAHGVGLTFEDGNQFIQLDLDFSEVVDELLPQELALVEGLLYISLVGVLVFPDRGDWQERELLFLFLLDHLREEAQLELLTHSLESALEGLHFIHEEGVSLLRHFEESVEQLVVQELLVHVEVLNDRLQNGDFVRIQHSFEQKETLRKFAQKEDLIVSFLQQVEGLSYLIQVPLHGTIRARHLEVLPIQELDSHLLLSLLDGLLEVYFGLGLVIENHFFELDQGPVVDVGGIFSDIFDVVDEVVLVVSLLDHLVSKKVLLHGFEVFQFLHYIS